MNLTCPTTRCSRMTTRVWQFVLIILTTTTLSACAVTRGNIGDTITPERVATMKKGETTRQEAIATLGAPDRILQINGREVFQYYHYDIKSSSLVLILLNLSRTQIKSDDLYLFFGKDGPLEEILFGHRTAQMTFRFWPWGD